MKKYLKAILSALLMVGLLGGVAACEPAEKSEAEKANSSSSKKQANTKPKAAEQTTTAKFKACVNDRGTDPEKVAVRNVTKVSGADKLRGYLDMPKVFTSYSGGLMGPNGGDGVLIASAFATCYKSENGLVTVYDRDGEILANGQF